jgi:dihydroorotate dehydrogenase (NAD+) catalytic subunit
VASGRDALELILAGATAVAVGTANFANPRAAIEVGDEIGRYMAARGVAEVSELVGAVKLEG